MALKKNIKLPHGRTLRLRLTVTRDGAPMNLTSAKFRLTAKVNVTDADEDAVFHVDTATVADPSTGVFEIEIPKTGTASIALGADSVDLVYDVVIQDSADKTYTLMWGILTVEPTVTKAEELT